MEDKYNEIEYIRIMLGLFERYDTVAMVGDSYDIYNFCRLLGDMKEEILEKTDGGKKTLVVRPDSGDPETVPVEVVALLAEKFGYTTNTKGYKVLPSYVRVIQGDGINENSLPKILQNLKAAGFSVDNIAFGMGGALLGAPQRDDLKYAMKASAIKIGEGDWRGFSKDPITDQGKKSKEGRLGLINQCGVGSCGFATVPEDIANQKGNILRTVFRNGSLLVEDTFQEIRDRAALRDDEIAIEETERF